MISELIKRHRLAIVFLGDVVIFWLSLIFVLLLRYEIGDFSAQFFVHFEPFIVVLILWLIIYYISNLYTFKALSSNLEITRNVTTTILISFFITITIFYIFSRFFDLTPKVNLVIFAFIFGGLDLVWRYLLRRVFIQKENRSNVLILASSPLVKNVIEHVNLHPQIGYSLYLFNNDIAKLTETIQKKSISLVVVDGQTLKNNTVSKMLYSLLPNQVEIMIFTEFFESLFGCIPLSEVEEEWFVREITENKSIYESIKRLIEFVASTIGIILALPFVIIISLLVITTSKGPIIYKQERMGKNNRPFILYKFRTMKNNHNGPLWTDEKDERLTFIGKVLRRTHLDEIPQLYNVLKGDISFIGPRPERTKLVKIYESIPYYEIRHIVKPGITGWAQLNYKPSTCIDEAQKKFEYDLYYIKNRSFILDLFIIIKTIRTLFIKNKNNT